ncbi:MAG: hypothetical protein R3302_06110, partial [Sulfurimonadaceae bacterium]|nr:hypothetical protein [Sulfurimonadaceae bacterium]
MYIKRYTLAAVLFMVIVGWYVYAFITQDIKSFDFFGTELPAMPVALWVVLPLIVLYLASVLHMSYYGLIATFKKRKYQKDHESFVDALRNAFLGKSNRYTQYKTDAYGVLGSVIDKSTLTPTDALDETGNEKIDAVLNLLREVKNGNIVELKKHQLDKENPLVVQNNLNRLERGKATPEDILSRSERYADEVNVTAYVKLVETAPLYAIEKYKAFMSKDALLVIAARINADEYTLEIANEALTPLINAVDLSAEDYLLLSVALGENTVPDQRLKLFENLSTVNEEATDAYLYTLFDLEMLAP